MEYEPIVFDIETTGLNPLAESWHDNQSHDAQAFCLGIGRFSDWRDTTNYNGNVTVLTNSTEYNFLNDITEHMEDLNDEMKLEGKIPFLCGFNSRKYDHPYLGARYARYRLNGWPFTHGLKRLDVFRVLKKETGRYWSQTDYAESIGIEVDDRFSGGDMQEAFADGNYEAIEEHAGGDIQELMEIMMNNRVECMSEFFDHYDVDKDPEQYFTDTIEVE